MVLQNYFRAHGLTPLVKKGATTEAAADKRIRATVSMHAAVAAGQYAAAMNATVAVAYV
jgi:hypothetical protein